MKLGYICTNFNNATYTSQAAKTLLSNKGHEIVIVVVDNQSNPEDVERLRDLAKQHAEVRLVLQGENIGYFEGLNAGMHYLRANHPDVVHMVVGNNDLLFGPEFVDSVARQLPALERYPVLSPDIVTLDGMHQNPHVISGVSWVRGLLYDLYYTQYYFAAVLSKVAQTTRRVSARGDEGQWRVPGVIHQGYGACYILGPCFFAHFSDLWAPTFLFGEEYFLTKQLNDQGMAVYYEPTITVRHFCNASTGKLPRRATWGYGREAHRIYRCYVGIFSSTKPPGW